jgi:type I restriction enzyme, S subunit
MLDTIPNGEPYVGLEHIEPWTGRLRLENQPDTVDSTVSVFGAGDVLLGKLRPYLAKVARPSFHGVCTSEVLALRPVTEYTQSYAMYSLLNEGYVRWLDSLTYGAKMPRVSPDQVANTHMPMPPTIEQVAIAAFLDKEAAKIDSLIAKNEKLIELLQEKRRALITRVVTKGLDPNVPMKDSGVEWIGKIPGHWEAERVKWAARMVSGHTPDKKVESYWMGGDIPWVSLADTGQLREVDYISNTAMQTTSDGIAHSSAHVLPAGTVVFSRDATIGLCGIIRTGMAVSQHFIGWICSPRLLPEYLLFVFRSMTEELERLTMGATVRTIGMPDVKSLSVPIPPVLEQEEIVRHVGQQRTQLDALIAKVRNAIERLKELRMALISAAVTGKIDVREEVP